MKLVLFILSFSQIIINFLFLVILNLAATPLNISYFRPALLVYRNNVLGGVCLLLVPIIGPFPGPGGTILLLAGLNFLAVNNPWAARLKKYIEGVGKSLIDYIFPDNRLIALIWDIGLGLIFLIGMGILIKYEIHFVWRSLIFSVLGFGVIAFLRNRHRWSTIKKFFLKKSGQ